MGFSQPKSWTVIDGHIDFLQRTLPQLRLEKKRGLTLRDSQLWSGGSGFNT